MPEIVEVYWLSNYLNTYKDHKINNVKAINPKCKISDFIMIKNLAISGVNTHGKLLWFEFNDSDLILVCHFGLHGVFSHNIKNSSFIEFELKNDKEELTLLYFNIRLNGSINVITKNILNDKIASLGDDFFKTKIDKTVLMNRLRVLTKNGTKLMNKKIVCVLLEQNKNKGLGSGIGNYLVAEILHDARISPHTTLEELINNQELVERLSNSIIWILRLVYLSSTENYFKKIDNKILEYVCDTRNNMPLNYNYYPEIDIDDKVFNCKVYKKNVTEDGRIVKEEKIASGRKCYWVATK